MYHPSRGGVRGGRDQFNWEDVKADKHRENYLGHSVKAPVGRWQKGKDLYWYTKDHGSEGSTKEEIRRIQEEEEDAMKEMLGLAPRKSKRPYGSQLDKREVEELLKKGKSGEEQASAYVDGERIQGLGFAPAPGQTGGEAGSRRAIELKRKDNVSRSPEQIISVGYVKEAEKDVTLPPAEDVETFPVTKRQQDVPAVSSEDEAASRKKRKEEKRKAKELRNDAKRGRRKAKKALKDDNGHRNKDKRMDSSRHGGQEEYGRSRHERKHTSPDYRSQRREGGSGKARYEGNDRDRNEEKAGRFSTGDNRKRKDNGSTSDGEHSRLRTTYRRSVSPEHRGYKIGRQDADRERKENCFSSSDDSDCVKRRKTERK